MFKKLVIKVYRIAVFTRHDADGSTYLFSREDFPDLREEPFVFENQLGDKLQGAFYLYDGCKSDRLIIFDHGMGVGHNSYMKEIETLARGGYKVLAYDHTGCTHSEGESIRGLSGSLADLDACITALKSKGMLDGVKLSVVGHSWGGYAAMNIVAYHKDIHSIVALSGFISLKDMLKQEMAGTLAPFRHIAYKYERMKNGDYADASALESLKSTNAKALIIHSDDDDTVSFKKHFLKIQREVDRGNIPSERATLLPVHGKLHNPNYTEDAAKYKRRLFVEISRKRRRKQLRTPEQKAAFKAMWDYERMTEQDPEIWKIIFEHLEK
ncbi:MAG: alpha/beta fold hydrolase [Clostridia bacterium]|nr:alpha/beta fold hydrolase [Clostridia bacterium]